jgi:hypothetical protein
MRVIVSVPVNVSGVSLRSYKGKNDVQVYAINICKYSLVLVHKMHLTLDIKLVLVVYVKYVCRQKC